METYSLLRQFADSWHLLFLFVFFIGVIVWAFRPGSGKVHRDTSNMIFRNDDRPMSAQDRTGLRDGVHGKPNEAR
jgi:cytochrome c oxidase cbb3-type subunit IV